MRVSGWPRALALAGGHVGLNGRLASDKTAIRNYTGRLEHEVCRVREFHKYEGLGNDLIFFMGSEDDVLARVRDRQAWMAALCDRHTGAGADGVMFVAQGSGDVTASISYYNADGTPAQMCGNGLRCACLLMYHTGLVGAGRMFAVHMRGAGRRRCVIEQADGRRGFVEVEIGSPERGRGAKGEPDRLGLSVLGHQLDVIPLSVSNPHAVIFDQVDPGDMEKLGPAIEIDPMFPDRVNVEFARVAPDGGIDLVVWERGCGFTRACGSGACATAVAAMWEGKVGSEVPVPVRLPGGTLWVRLDSDDVIWLRGEARRVYTATMDPESF